MKMLPIAIIARVGVGALPATAQEATHGCACFHNKPNGAHCNAVGKGGHYDITYRPNTNNAFFQVTRQP